MEKGKSTVLCSGTLFMVNGSVICSLKEGGLERILRPGTVGICPNCLVFFGV